MTPRGGRTLSRAERLRLLVPMLALFLIGAAAIAFVVCLNILSWPDTVVIAGSPLLLGFAVLLVFAAIQSARDLRTEPLEYEGIVRAKSSEDWGDERAHYLDISGNKVRVNISTYYRIKARAHVLARIAPRTRRLLSVHELPPTAALLPHQE